VNRDELLEKVGLWFALHSIHISICYHVVIGDRMKIDLDRKVEHSFGLLVFLSILLLIVGIGMGIAIALMLL